MNMVEVSLFGGSNIGLIEHNSGQVFSGGPLSSASGQSVMLNPGDNITVQTSSGTCPTITTQAIDP
jgi:hypothetical protein